LLKVNRPSEDDLSSILRNYVTADKRGNILGRKRSISTFISGGSRKKYLVGPGPLSFGRKRNYHRTN